MARKGNASLSYHRENLRRDLIEAGLSYVSDHGHDTLSVRTLASLVGVSSGAPYYHFADRRALLLAVACEGYERLSGSGADTLRSISDPVERLIGLSRHFLAFAHAHPRLFELMYESELTRPELDPVIKDAQTVGFSLLRDALAAAIPDVPEEEFTTRILSAWSMLYGFSSLQNKKILKPYAMSPDVSESVVRLLMTSILSA
ncbi:MULTISPECIES: TetR/AcrR family transcriptional regulator [unclassified Azospirillum]|uniref:TetR/AcrR family transcriptional regulator n=1 Tax=unclassified Azospirillum TaxID=2630922 RepID=UPI000B667F93|nr:MULTISPECIES: TetR/AcrR family transcriptional regulator [unclassified Azospirillum]SNS51498.1 transcriptional regulator, TetR family [Azospirillum sp. RU38E]SNS70045.1 transcriptional regulator, TetR family [Azospirillum sp. RU37A]